MKEQQNIKDGDIYDNVDLKRSQAQVNAWFDFYEYGSDSRHLVVYDKQINAVPDEIADIKLSYRNKHALITEGLILINPDNVNDRLTIEDTKIKLITGSHLHGDYRERFVRNSDVKFYDTENVLQTETDYVKVALPTAYQVYRSELPFKLTEQALKSIPPLEKELYPYQERTVPDVIHGMRLSPEDKFVLVVDHFFPSEEQKRLSTRKQFPDAHATYRLDDRGRLVVESVVPDGQSAIVLKNSEVEFFNNKNQIAMNNLEFIKNQMTYLGFGEKSITDAFDKSVDQGHERFSLTVKPKEETLLGNSAKFVLNFNKSNQTNMYFFNTFEAILIDKSDIPIRSQTFHNNSTKGVTAKESINLLEGRAVKTVLNYNGEDSKVFAKLNFEETNKHGNFKYKTFNENYGVDVKDILEKAELKSGLKLDSNTLDNFVKSLEKGNLIKSDFKVDGKEISGYVALNPEFKNLDHFDADLKKVFNKRLGDGMKAGEKEETSVSVSVGDSVKQSVDSKPQKSGSDANPLLSGGETDFTDELIDEIESGHSKLSGNLKKTESTPQLSQPVQLANLSEKQTQKLQEFYQSGQGSEPSVTPKQLQTVPRFVLGYELNNNQRRELFFGGEIKLDDKTAIRAEISGSRSLDVTRFKPGGALEISTLRKSDVEYDTKTRELKPFESAEEIPERSKALSR
ncbi:MAG: hypothetical protein M5Z89_05065 [Olivibacter sp.]|nr:hypothetical protein [Olivibacter sp. UJ_SKK_5.1]